MSDSRHECIFFKLKSIYKVIYSDQNWMAIECGDSAVYWPVRRAQRIRHVPTSI